MKKEKITLKELTQRDAKNLTDLLNASQDVCLTLDIPFPQSVATQKKYLTTALQFQKTGLYKHFTIRREEVIGMISFKNINLNDRYADVGYWMSDGCNGKGYMTQALKQMTQYGFTELNLHKIYAYVCIENLASKRVLEKVGYKKEVTLKKHKKWKGKKWADVDIYSKFK